MATSAKISTSTGAGDPFMASAICGFAVAYSVIMMIYWLIRDYWGVHQIYNPDTMKWEFTSA